MGSAGMDSTEGRGETGHLAHVPCALGSHEEFRSGGSSAINGCTPPGLRGGPRSSFRVFQTRVDEPTSDSKILGLDFGFKS